MAIARASLSLTTELDQILRQLAARMNMDRSRLVETLLRESPLVQQEVSQRRGGVSTKRGRDVTELLILGRVAARQWEQRVQSGQIKPARRP